MTWPIRLGGHRLRAVRRPHRLKSATVNGPIVCLQWINAST